MALTISKIKTGFSLDVTTHRLITQDQSQKEVKNIYKHPHLLNVLGWIMENQLYKRQQCTLDCLGPKKVFESLDSPTDLDALYLKLSPLKPLSDHPFEEKPIWSKMLVLVCYDFKRITHAEVMVSNSWGELFEKSVDFKTSSNRKDQIMTLVKAMQTYAAKDLRMHIFQYGQMHDPEIVYQVKKVYNDSNTEIENSDKLKQKPFLDRL